MAQARQRSEWARTQSVMALLANIHRDPRRSKVFQPEDFDPFKSEKLGTVEELNAVLRRGR